MRWKFLEFCDALASDEASACSYKPMRKMASASLLPSKSCTRSSHQQSLTWEHVKKGIVGSSLQPQVGALVVVVSWHIGVQHWTSQRTGLGRLQLIAGPPENCSLLLSIRQQTILFAICFPDVIFKKFPEKFHVVQELLVWKHVDGHCG